MVSGGADSMALLELFRRTHDNNKLEVFHFHHGPSKNVEQKKFRNEAQALVKKYCQNHKIHYFAVQNEEVLTSESQFRKARLSALKNHLIRNTQFKEPLIAWGHHEQDLLETRLIRLIRGVGPKGIKSMAIFYNRHFRPLLNISGKDIRDFVISEKISFIDDPSNVNQRYFRNWLRYGILPSLEKKRPGSLATLARSLETISENLEDKGAPINSMHQAFAEFGKTQTIPWTAYLLLSEHEQVQLLSHVFNSFGENEWSRNSIKETLKQLARGKNGHIFKVSGVLIKMDEAIIRFEKVSRKK
ncbi:MAG: tRNA lysidine(34) synthetase TilS [Bdellovibrionota bacterium]